MFRVSGSSHGTAFLCRRSLSILQSYTEDIIQSSRYRLGIQFKRWWRLVAPTPSKGSRPCRS